VFRKVFMIMFAGCDVLPPNYGLSDMDSNHDKASKALCYITPSDNR